MAAEISSVRKKKPDGFMTLLSSAACEWFLMFLLFIDASLSYLLVKFAQYCELETPCLLCSRRGLEGKKSEFYWSLLCSSHREEISSLVSCPIHCKFADIHNMCEECLIPIAMQNKSNSESHRLLVGKSWLDIDRSALQSLMINKQIQCSSDIRTCSCCTKTWRAKSSAERLLEVNSIGFGASRANLKPPLPRAPGYSRFSRSSLKRLRDKFTGPMNYQSTERIGSGTMSHVGYAKLKFSSDSESEIPFSEDDDDGGNTDYSSKTYGKSEHNIQYNRIRLYESPVDNADSKKQKHQGFEGNPSTLDQPHLLDSRQHESVDSFSPDVLIEHTVRDHEQEETCNKLDPTSAPELISLCDGLQPLNVIEGLFGASLGTSESSDSIFDMPAITVLSELLSFCSVSPLSSELEIPNQINDRGTSEKRGASEAGHAKAAEETSSDDDHMPETNNMQQIDASTQTDEDLELLDGNGTEPIKTSNSAETEIDRPQVSNDELGISTKETINIDHSKHDGPRIDVDSSSQIIPILAEKIEENGLQVSDYELGPSSKETNEKVLNKYDEPRIDEDSSSQVHPVSDSLKKNESTPKFPDIITISNAEGKDMVEQLKRQIEHDRNSLSSLYKDLEEERNASAIAANEAMAMITRLQEEKAALHMEALQYLRMMEEQAEYDMEALRRANDLLAEKDKELQDLEYELEFYRNNMPDKSEIYDVQEDSTLENRVAADSETNPGASSNS